MENKAEQNEDGNPKLFTRSRGGLIDLDTIIFYYLLCLESDEGAWAFEYKEVKLNIQIIHQ